MQRARAVTLALAGGSVVGVAVLADLAAHTAATNSSATSGVTAPAAATSPAGATPPAAPAPTNGDDFSSGPSFAPPGPSFAPSAGPAPVRSGAS